MKNTLFLPGFATTNQVWEKQISDFSTTNQVADCIIAWSMGCFDAVRLYYEDPSKIKKLVLVSGTPKFIKDKTFPQGLPKALFRNLERKTQADLESGLKYFYGLIGDFDVFEKLPPFKKNEILKSLERLKTEDIRNLLPEISIPVLLVHGDKDQICPIEASKYMAEVIPKSRLVVFEGAGHAPFLEQPERFNEIVRDFLVGDTGVVLMTDLKEKIKRNFSRSAGAYDDYAALHKEIARKVLAGIPQKDYKYILDIGTGTGFLAYGLAERFKKAKIFAIDIAPGMIEHARARSPYPNIQFQEGDGEKIPFAKNTFDLVASSSSLQWMRPDKCFAEAKRVLKPEGDFYFSMFGPRTLWELREVMGVGRELGDLKFKGIKTHSEIREELFPDFMAMLKFIKGLGAQSSNISLGPESRRVLALAEKEYNKKYGSKEGVIATFEIIYGSMGRE